jgi:hypothetical protein
MDVPKALPNGDLLLDIIHLSRDRLNAGSKAAISLPLLREILMVAVSKLPFDDDFYLSTYQDIRAAHEDGGITDLRMHFIERGYFEGRLGADPKVDEDFYKETYPDVATAIANSEVKSGVDHYMRAGASEGRFANSEDKQLVENWLRLGGRM